MPPPVLTEPTDLLGSWTLSRTIDDCSSARGAERSHVTGQTELVRESDGRVRWSESGTLTRHGVAVPVSRTLYAVKRGDRWAVTFSDGRDFHPWTPGVDVVHGCAPDTYVGRIEVASPNLWSVQWRVNGPAKNYLMTSQLSRQL